ncbi:Protein of unknown function DUF4184 [Actinobacteria bacterium OK074]|nr:Protein of unknown function DUF4184 [Actinobacteria bacterium OK074]
MPFTLSHAAAVLPAVRRDGTGRGRLVPAVLVAGSFAPDVPYYAANVLPGGMELGDAAHSFAAVFTADVAVSWALVGLWLLLREPLVALLPRRRQGRIATLLRCGVPRREASAPTAAWWYASAALGSLTHVLWDAFTHQDGWGRRLLPVLGRDLSGMPLYSWLQYGCSVFGAAVIAGFVAFALRRLPSAEPVGVPVLSARDRRLACAVLAGCAGVGAAQRAVQWWADRGAVAKPWDLIPTLCFGGGAGLVLGLVAYGVVVRVRRPVPPEVRAAEASDRVRG